MFRKNSLFGAQTPLLLMNLRARVSAASWKVSMAKIATLFFRLGLRNFRFEKQKLIEQSKGRRGTQPWPIDDHKRNVRSRQT